MRKSAFAWLAAAACFLTGCAEVGKIEDFLTSPKTLQAASTLKNGVSAFVCSVADAALVAQQIEDAISAGQSVRGTDGKLYVSSAIVCSSLGGSVSSTGIVQ